MATPSNPATTFDVLIVGGGLVGAALAVALRESRLTVGVIEAAPPAAGAPHYDDRALALAYGSRRILGAIGVWEGIERGGAMPLKHIHVSDRGRFGVTRLHAEDAGLEALGYVVTHRVLGVALYDALRAQPNATLFAPATVQTVALEDEGARVAVQTAGGERLLTSRLLVAADGINSSVRDMLRIETRRDAYDQTAIVTSVTAQTRPGDMAYERFTESGPLALLPVDAERFAVVWTVPAQRAATVLAWDDDTFRAELQQVFGERLGAFIRVGRRQSHPLALLRVAEHVRPRFALIGNAAHAVHPVAGQGFNLGLRDVAALAQVLVETTANGGDPGDLAALRRYAEWRARDNRVTSAFTDSLIRVFANDYLPFVLGRNLGLLAVDMLPPVKRGLIRITSGLAGRLPRLACGLPLRSPAR